MCESAFTSKTDPYLAVYLAVMLMVLFSCWSSGAITMILSESFAIEKVSSGARCACSRLISDCC